MNKPTIFLLLLAALGLGSLIGASFVDEPADAPLTAVQQHKPPVQSAGGAPTFRFIAPGDLPVEVDDFGRTAPSTTGENYISRNEAWKTETVVIELPIDGKIEYKAMMAQGDTIVFDWTTDAGQVYFDFHGHDEAFGQEFFVRYEESDGDKQSGMIVAAFSGEHGWYWQNMADGPTTITLRVAGFFDSIVKIDIECYQ